MRVALVHDWLTGMRGGERVLERIARMFPGAPIYTLVWKRGGVTPRLESHPIRTSFLQHWPGATTNYRWFLPFFPRAIESFDLSEFDAVVSTSHAIAKGAKARPGTPHLCYVHTPMRYIWELESQYFPPDRYPGPLGAFVRHTCADLRTWDVATATRPTALVANSAHIADRIRRHWNRGATVVHPCVAVERFKARDTVRAYSLVAGAMAPYKRLDLALEAFGTLRTPLRVVGEGQDAGRLRSMAPPNVTFDSVSSDAAITSALEGADALIFPGEEDFGILPVEAMAAGCPVVAYGRGGALETVGRGATSAALARVAAGGVARVPGGVLFGRQDAASIVEAVQLLDAEPVAPSDLRAIAEPFNGERFDREMRAALVAAGIPPKV